MANDDKIKDEKLQYHISKETAEISALPSEKIEEIFPFNQKQIIKQATFAYSPLGKPL